MTVAEASKKLGISRSEMYRLIHDRRISHYRIGGKIVLLPADLDAFLADCRVPAVTATVVRSRPRLKHIRLTRV